MKRILQNLIIYVFVGCVVHSLFATRLFELKVLDREYLMIHFRDGVVRFVDDGIGANAHRGHHSDASNSRAVYFGAALDKANAADVNNWLIKSADDANFGESGVTPTAVFRKTRVNGMSLGPWGNNDWTFDYTYEHFIYLQLPSSMETGKTYTIELNENLNSDTTLQTITYDIFNCPTEAIHTNLVGYMSSSRMKSADLYHFLGDGGYRDYSDFLNNEVFLYNIETQDTISAGSVEFWMTGKQETNHNLTGSDVWTVDFTGFSQEGTYRLAVEGIGCSQDFEIRDDIYHDPYKLSVLGYFYMRIGQDNLDMTPVPRRPLYIQNQDPGNCKIYVTDMDPYHPSWGTFASGDRWDQPAKWASYKKSGNPTNPRAIGGHSDALDWDRHLHHVFNVYDLCQAYIISDGALDDDDLRIAESGNGIPDILDEVRNEVDFWLNLRYKKGYSHGITNPDGNNILYQADNTPIAAWANSLNCAMLAYCFQIAGQNDLANTYQDSAIVAYNYANSLADPMLNTKLGDIRGRDFKMMTAAYLYNLTGNTVYENTMKNLSVVTGANSSINEIGSFDQYWGTAAYLLTKRAVNYPELMANMKSSVIAKAKSKEANFINTRPSRRGYSAKEAWWQTAQDMPRTVLAHAISEDPLDQLFFLDALLLEADWGLGRNPLNMIQMTTASTELADKRSVENCYTAGRDDGTPGLHPGHTPYLNVDPWGGEMIGSRPDKVLSRFYPNISQWPHASKYINTRFIWAHSEFTPRQTMKGKALIYAYLYSLSKSGTSFVPELLADAGLDQRIVDEDENGKERVQLDGTNSFSSHTDIIHYQWYSDSSEIATGPSPTVVLEVGSHILVLEVEDESGVTSTDTVTIEIITLMHGKAGYNFETKDQLNDWRLSNSGSGGLGEASISSEKARRGEHSVKITAGFVKNSAHVFRKAGSLDDDIESVKYYVWIPQALVDSSKAVKFVDDSQAGSIECYLLHLGSNFRRDTMYHIYNLEGDAWNEVSIQIPDDVLNSAIYQIGLVFDLQGISMDENIYIDDVIFEKILIPADYDFENLAQFDEWNVENWGSSGSSLNTNQSTVIARNGLYSYELQGDFVAESEYALRRNGTVAADVASFTYYVWIPQALIDSANVQYAKDPERAGLIQNYLMHVGWAWESEGYPFHQLIGDAWNKIDLEIPEHVDPTTIQSIGMSFKMYDVDAGELSIYIDDIYFNRMDLTAVENPDPGRINVPGEFKLYHNYPNPFNPETRIKYNLPKDAKVQLTIYDIMGHHIKDLVNEKITAGSYEIVFNANNLASGVYLYVLRAGQYKDVKKMILLK